MFVKLTRTFRNSPFVELRESDAQYLADVVVTDAELAANKRSRSERSLGPRFSPRTPLAPYPLDHCFLSISSVAAACDERTHKVSTHTSLIFVLLCKAQK